MWGELRWGEVWIAEKYFREAATGHVRTQKNPRCGGWQISWGRLLLNNLLDWDSLSTYERGPSMVGSLGSSCRIRDFCPALAALISTVQYMFTSSHTFSLPLSSSPSNLGRQTCRVAFFLICCNDCKTHTPTMYPCYWRGMLFFKWLMQELD